MRTIAHLSDLHFGRHRDAIVEDLLHSIHEHQPDLVAVSGDFTQRAKRSEFAEAERFLQRIGVPKLTVPGNHDVPLYNLFNRAFRAFQNYDRYIDPYNQPGGIFQDGELLAFGINTARRFTRKNGRLSHAQIAQINSVFSAAPDQVAKVLITHHPLDFAIGQAAVQVAGRSRLALDAVARSGVRVLLSGHHHRAHSGATSRLESAGSVLVIHAGTAVSTRVRDTGKNDYNLIALAPNRASITVMTWENGQGFAPGRPRSYRFAQAHWQSEDQSG